MIGEKFVSYFLMTAVSGSGAWLFVISSVGADGHESDLGRLLQVLVAFEAAGIVNKLLASLADVMPVDFVRFLEDFHGRVDNAVLGLDQEIVQRVVMGEVTIVTGSSKSHLVIAPVGVLPISGRDGRIGVATGTELIIAGCVKCSIEDRPAGNHTNTQARENHQ